MKSDFEKGLEKVGEHFMQPAGVVIGGTGFGTGAAFAGGLLTNIGATTVGAAVTGVATTSTTAAMTTVAALPMVGAPIATGIGTIATGAYTIATAPITVPILVVAALGYGFYRLLDELF